MPTILIATDETHVASRLVGVFSDAGLAVLAVQDGVEAYETARVVQPAAIVADYRLGRLGGLELCTRLNRDLLTTHIPVVLLIARGFGMPDNAGLQNVRQVMTKPAGPHRVLAVLQNLLSSTAIPATGPAAFSQRVS